MIHHEGIKFSIPLPWSMFEPIQALSQSAILATGENISSKSIPLF